MELEIAQAKPAEPAAVQEFYRACGYRAEVSSDRLPAHLAARLRQYQGRSLDVMAMLQQPPGRDARSATASNAAR